MCTCPLYIAIYNYIHSNDSNTYIHTHVHPLYVATVYHDIFFLRTLYFGEFSE